MITEYYDLLTLIKKKKKILICDYNFDYFDWYIFQLFNFDYFDWYIFQLFYFDYFDWYIFQLFKECCLF